MSKSVILLYSQSSRVQYTSSFFQNFSTTREMLTAPPPTKFFLSHLDQHPMQNLVYMFAIRSSFREHFFLEPDLSSFLRCPSFSYFTPEHPGSFEVSKIFFKLHFFHPVQSCASDAWPGQPISIPSCIRNLLTRTTQILRYFTAFRIFTTIPGTYSFMSGHPAH